MPWAARGSSSTFRSRTDFPVSPSASSSASRSSSSVMSGSSSREALTEASGTESPTAASTIQSFKTPRVIRASPGSLRRSCGHGPGSPAMTCVPNRAGLPCGAPWPPGFGVPGDGSALGLRPFPRPCGGCPGPGSRTASLPGLARRFPPPPPAPRSASRRPGICRR